MCPICVSTTALAISGAVPGGGLFALILKRLRDRHRARFEAS